MPYARDEDLPPAVQKLPRHARDIFRAAFNNAWVEYADRGIYREEIAFRVAWAAIRRAGYSHPGDK